MVCETYRIYLHQTRKITLPEIYTGACVVVQLDLPLIGWLLLFLSKNLDVSISAAASEEVDRGKDNSEL